MGQHSDSVAGSDVSAASSSQHCPGVDGVSGGETDDRLRVASPSTQCSFFTALFPHDGSGFILLSGTFLLPSTSPIFRFISSSSFFSPDRLVPSPSLFLSCQSGSYFVHIFNQNKVQGGSGIKALEWYLSGLQFYLLSVLVKDNMCWILIVSISDRCKLIKEVPALCWKGNFVTD